MEFLKKHLLVALTLVALFVTGTPGAYASKYVLSSGYFPIPANTMYIAYEVLNNSQTAQTIHVTIYQWIPGQSKSAVPPGRITNTVNPRFIMNSQISPPNLSTQYEVVVEVDILTVLPTVMIWAGKDSTTFVPGTTILPADFVINESQEIILDNAISGKSGKGRSFAGMWCTSTAAGHYGVDSLQSCGSAADTYRWIPTIPAPGTYSVYVWWTAQASQSTNVPISVTHLGGTTTIAFDQTTNGGKWVLHGTYSFDTGLGGWVMISDENGQACADAVRFEPVP
jgi:hypothetical protein